MLHICNKFLLGTERVSLDAFDFHSALSFRMWLLSRAKTSRSFVRSSRLVGKRIRLVSGEITKNGLNTRCEQLGLPILATTLDGTDKFFLICRSGLYRMKFLSDED